MTVLALVLFDTRLDSLALCGADGQGGAGLMFSCQVGVKAIRWTVLLRRGWRRWPRWPTV